MTLVDAAMPPLQWQENLSGSSELFQTSNLWFPEANPEVNSNTLQKKVHLTNENSTKLINKAVDDLKEYDTSEKKYDYVSH